MNGVMTLDEYQATTGDTAIYPSVFDLTLAALERRLKKEESRTEQILFERAIAALRLLKQHDLDPKGNPYYPVLGLIGEAGEIANKVQKIMRDQLGEIKTENVADIRSEVGDMEWFTSEAANQFGFLLRDAMEENRAKLLDRQERGKLAGSGDKR